MPGEQRTDGFFEQVSHLGEGELGEVSKMHDLLVGVGEFVQRPAEAIERGSSLGTGGVFTLDRVVVNRLGRGASFEAADVVPHAVDRDPEDPRLELPEFRVFLSSQALRERREDRLGDLLGDIVRSAPALGQGVNALGVEMHKFMPGTRISRGGVTQQPRQVGIGRKVLGTRLVQGCSIRPECNAERRMVLRFEGPFGRDLVGSGRLR